VNGVAEIALTKLDVLDARATIPVCTGYRVDGTEVTAFPSDAATLERVEPVVENVEGWEEPVGSARSMEELPAKARRYLEYLEQLLEIPIRYVSVGPRPDQTIEVP
jgi:adenylosuccinate synthase